MPIGNPIRKQNESRMVSVLATSGQTVFTVQGGYRINQISVFRNGVRLSPADDYTAGDGSTVTLNTEANVNDRIDFHIFDTFTVQNAIVSAASTQTISGDLVVNGKVFGALDASSLNLTGIVTATELDLNGKGDISGDLKVTGISTFTNVDAAGIVTARQGLRINANGLNVSGVSTFQAVQGTTGTFSGAVSGTTGTFTGDVDIADKIVHTGDTNTAIRFSGADTIKLETGGSERLKVDATGDTIVSGTLFADSDLFVVDQIRHTGDTNTAIRFPAADTISFETAGSEGIRIDSAGRLLVNTNSSQTAYGLNHQLQVEGTNAATSSFSLTRNSNDSNPPYLTLAKSRGTSIGSNTIINSGDYIGVLSFNAADGTNRDHMVAQIHAHCDGTPGENDVPGRLVFYTTADGANSSTERMRIDSAGRVGINRTPTQHPLEIQHASEPTVSFWRGSTKGAAIQAQSGGTYFYSYQNAPLLFSVNSASGFTERLRIASDGEVGINMTPSNGQMLAITGRSGYDDIVQITAVGTNIGSRINLTNTGTGKARINATNNELVLQTGGTDRLLIDSSGRIYIGVSPQGRACRMHISGDNFPTAALGGSQVPLIVSNSDGDYGLQIGAFSSGNGFLQATRNDGTATAYNIELNPSGGSVIVGDSSTGGDILFANSAGGIVLGNTSNADANTLDYYEEGSFTPRLRAHDSFTGAVNGSGSYQRIGNRVWIHISFNGVSTTSIPSGKIIRIDQLPYAAVGVSAAYETTNTWMVYGVTMRESTTFYTSDGVDNITGIYATSAGQWVNTTTNDFNQGTIYLNFNMNYRVAAQ